MWFEVLKHRNNFLHELVVLECFTALHYAYDGGCDCDTAVLLNLLAAKGLLLGRRTYRQLLKLRMKLVVYAETVSLGHALWVFSLF